MTSESDNPLRRVYHTYLKWEGANPDAFMKLKWRFLQYSSYLLAVIGALAAVRLLQPTSFGFILRFGALISFVIIGMYVLFGGLYFWEYKRHELTEPQADT
jgi:hypothetical protein